MGSAEFPDRQTQIRLDAIDDSRYALYFICHTNLVDSFRELCPDTFTYEGNRALVFELEQSLPESELKRCIAKALAYHLNS